MGNISDREWKAKWDKWNKERGRDTTDSPSMSASTKEEAPLCCPRCKSTYISANKSGFGLGKALAGGAITGGVGLLAGFIGSGKVKCTCLKCGHEWKP